MILSSCSGVKGEIDFYDTNYHNIKSMEVSGMQFWGSSVDNVQLRLPRGYGFVMNGQNAKQLISDETIASLIKEYSESRDSSIVLESIKKLLQ